MQCMPATAIESLAGYSMGNRIPVIDQVMLLNLGWRLQGLRRFLHALRLRL